MYFLESFWGSRVQLGHACTECAGLPIQLLTDDAWQGFQSGALTGLLSESSMLRRCCINAAVELQSGLHLSHAQVSRGNDGDSEEGMQASRAAAVAGTVDRHNPLLRSERVEGAARSSLHKHLPKVLPAVAHFF